MSTHLLRIRATEGVLAAFKTDGLKTDAATRYLKITESAASSETEEVAFSDLAVNDRVDVYGDTDIADSTCLKADVVQKYVNAP